jgi:hypothetical protein
MMKKETKHWLLLLIGLMAWFGVITDFTTAINKDLAAGLLVSDTFMRLLGYYTILTNIFVAIVATTCGLFPDSRWGRFFATPKVFGSVVSSIVFVGIVFHIMLSDIYNPDGIKAVANYLNHYITPLAMLIYWLIFPTKLRMPLSMPFVWGIYPLIYAIYIAIRGEMIGEYPYFFLDVTTLGYPQALLNGLVLFLVVAAIGFVVRAGVHYASRRQNLAVEN